MNKNMKKKKKAGRSKNKIILSTLIIVCSIVTTSVIVYFCYFLTTVLVDMNAKVTHIDKNLETMTMIIEKTTNDLKKTTKKLDDSWWLSW
jgi:hypothetical protein